MFDLMPFERRTRNLSNFFDAFDKTFFSDFPASFSEIRTDILDQGDKFLLQAELPGFDKEDIKIDLNGDTFPDLRRAQGRERGEEGGRLRPPRTPLRLLRAQLRRLRHRRRKISAAYKNGVLELELPKKVPARRRPARSSSNKPPGFWNPPSASAGGGFRIPVQIFSRIRLFRREFML